MLSAEAHIATDRPSRYLTQLCKHLSHTGRHLGHRPRAHLGDDAQTLSAVRTVAQQARVDWSETEGRVSLPWGTIALQATPGLLTLRIAAVDAENLRRLQTLATGHMERFGRRERLRMNWQEPESAVETADCETAATARASGGTTAGRRQLLGLATAVVLLLAAHLGLGGVIAAHWRWTGGAVAAALAVVLVKAAVLGGLAVYRGRPAKRR
ncbi:DUF2218 domain-containing protein [Streptomyces sp. AS58]|uniref:DUF2218 domain-containing protein n=1 Tax=Streptomyces sp. AS58 TaxID=1519489 RepID=UPI0007C7649E|nr:DUF2218 domain-containing protein [Streptomyces sp. AS58]